MDAFEVLGIPKTATFPEVKAAWRKKAHEFHPDTGGDPKQFNKVREAYAKIDSEEKLLSYVRNGGEQKDGMGFDFSAFDGNMHPDITGTELDDLFGDLLNNRRPGGGSSFF